MRLTRAEARLLFSYDPETGALRWRTVRSNRIKVGEIAGTVAGNGRRMIALMEERVYDYQIAWLLIYGEWVNEVDHIDRNPLNNRIANLRAATRAQNSFNREKQSNNKSGYKGVSWDKNNKQWVAQLKINGRQTKLGRFNRKENAALAYNFAAYEHYHEFAFLNNDSFNVGGYRGHSTRV